MKIFDQEFKGLSQDEVLKRIQDGKTHFVESKSTKTYKEIIFNNIFTFFNLINIILFACIIFVGSYRNTLFISVVFFNTLTGIYQEIKAKKTLDKLSIFPHPLQGTPGNVRVPDNALREYFPDKCAADNIHFLCRAEERQHADQ